MTPYDSPDYHALIRGIRLLDRAGDTDRATLARLVTADWLEERGETERAELIRLDLEPLADGTTELARMKRQWELTQLVGRHETDGDGLKSRGWADGFIAKTDCTLAWWLAHGPALCRRHPVRSVEVTDRQPIHSYGGAYWHVPTRPLDPSERHSLSSEFRPHMPTSLPPPSHVARGLFFIYPDGAAASAALNTAALLWAEAEADRQHTDPA